MWDSRCRACEAKDAEILHLLALITDANERADKASARLAEAVAPGVVSRSVPRPVIPKREPARERETINFPGYEREYAPDAPSVVE